MIKPRIILIPCLSILFTLLACSDNGEGGPDPEPTIGASLVLISDLENDANSSDIQVTFRASSNEEFVTGYRAYVTTASSVNTFTLADAEGLSSDRYTDIAKSGSDVTTFLKANMNDTDGNVIQEGVEYYVYVLTRADGETVTANKLSLRSNPLTLEKTDILEIVAEMPIGTGGVEVDADGNIFCSDFGQSLQSSTGSLIYKVTPTGETSVFASGFVGASGNIIGPDGNFYQSNISGGFVSKIDPVGNITTFVTGMAGPVGLVFDSEANLFVANCSNNTIQKVTPTGEASLFSTGGGTFNCPNGITVDENDNLYIANFSNGNITQIDPQGNSTVLWTAPSGNAGHLVYRDQFLYVVDRGGNQIVKLDLQGNATVIAGSGTRGHKEGPALAANLSLPNDLAFSHDGKYLYINDSKTTAGTPANSALNPTYLKRLRLEKED